MSNNSKNYACFGLAGILATVITGYIVYKNNKKVQDKVDQVLDVVKEKAENEKVEKVKEKTKETVDKAVEVVKEKTEVAKKAVKKAGDKALVKAFEFSLKHPKITKGIVCGAGATIIGGIGAMIGASTKRRREKYGGPDQVFDDILDDENLEKLRDLIADISLKPDECIIMTYRQAASGS